MQSPLAYDLQSVSNAGRQNAGIGDRKPAGKNGFPGRRFQKECRDQGKQAGDQELYTGQLDRIDQG